MKRKKKTILILGAVLAAFLMLMMPTINIVNAEVVQNEKRIDNLNKVTNIETKNEDIILNDILENGNFELNQIKEKILNLIEGELESNIIIDLIIQFFRAIFIGIPMGIGLIVLTFLAGIQYGIIPEGLKESWQLYIEEFPVVSGIFAILGLLAYVGMWIYIIIEFIRGFF